MPYYLKTNSEKKLLDLKTEFMICIHIINKIIDDNHNYCLLDTIYNHINKYAKDNNIYIYYNNKYRNLNTLIKKKYKSIYNFIKTVPIYHIDNNIIYKK